MPTKTPAYGAQSATTPLAPFPIDRRDPTPRDIQIDILFCGVCHSDIHFARGEWPFSNFPCVPGHEIVGRVTKVGKEVKGFKAGDLAAVGCMVDSCRECACCSRGLEQYCQKGMTLTYGSPDIHMPGKMTYGGYSRSITVDERYVLRLSERLDPAAAAPLLCAGITTFNALRNSGARPGDVVAVLGLGGLGHLGVQYAAKMGFKTVAIARGKDKETLARQLGASSYIDSQSQNPAAELLKLGGASVIISTVTVGDAMSAVQSGLAVNGTLMVIGAAESLQVAPITLLMGRRSVKGWYSGTAIDSQDTLAFSARLGVRSMNELFPLERVNEAYARMMSGKARFRVVLKMK